MHSYQEPFIPIVKTSDKFQWLMLAIYKCTNYNQCMRANTKLWLLPLTSLLISLSLLIIVKMLFAKSGKILPSIAVDISVGSIQFLLIFPICFQSVFMMNSQHCFCIPVIFLLKKSLIERGEMSHLLPCNKSNSEKKKTERFPGKITWTQTHCAIEQQIEGGTHILAIFLFDSVAS